MRLPAVKASSILTPPGAPGAGAAATPHAGVEPDERPPPHPPSRCYHSRLTPSTHRWLRLSCSAFLLAYFVYFTYDGLRVHFAVDDIGNMAHYYRGGPGALVLSQFTLWRGDYRPMGGLFYVPILTFAGLNPVPYQAALLVILAANVYLVYRFARLLGAGELAAALAALVACYHAGLHNLYYNAACVYDVLCCFFYLAAFVYYLRIRHAGRVPGARQIAAFLTLYLCALNSKEMAVTLPLMLAVYEWIYHPPEGWNRAALVAWLRGPARMALIANALTALDVYGKLFGPEPLIAAVAYRPVFALQRARDFQRLSLGELLFGWGSGWGGILLLWAALAYLAWRRDREALRFAWWFMVLTPLPIEFLVGRGQACLYIPLAGWAVFASVIFVDLAGALARVLEREPFGRRLGRSGIVAVLVAVAVFFWARQNRQYKRTNAEPAMASLGYEDWDVIQQFRAVNPQVRPGSKVAFLDDPFHSWDMLFVAELWFRDRTLDIHVQRHGPLTPLELAQQDYIFTFDRGKLVTVPPPTGPSQMPTRGPFAPVPPAAGGSGVGGTPSRSGRETTAPR